MKEIDKEIDFVRAAPGRRSKPEEGRRAFLEAEALREALWPMNVPLAAEYIRQNRPSPEAIALLGVAWHEHLTLPDRRERETARKHEKVFRLLDQKVKLGQIHERIGYTMRHLRTRM